MGAQPDLSSLLSIREAKGISLQQIAEVTKISVGALRAIETGHFEQLPGGVYSISYIKQYARHIGVPEQDLLTQYNAKMGVLPASPVEEPPEKESAGEKFRRFCNRLAEAVLGGSAEAEPPHHEPRFAAHQPAKVTLMDGAKHGLLAGTVLDISRSGVGIRVPALLALGSSLRVEVGNIVADCEVRNCRPNNEGSFDVGLKVGRVLSKSGY